MHVSVRTEGQSMSDWAKKNAEAISAQMQKDGPEVDGKAVRLLMKKIANELSNLFEGAIQGFYDDYAPRSYTRRGSLFNVPVITPLSDDIVIEFDPHQITMRNGSGEEDGLYTTVFKEGWHGGALKGPEHPKPDGRHAYWRTGNNFSTWGEEATRAPEKIRPFSAISEIWDDYKASRVQQLWEETSHEAWLQYLKDKGWF